MFVFWSMELEQAGGVNNSAHTLSQQIMVTFCFNLKSSQNKVACDLILEFNNNNIIGYRNR